MGMFYTIRNPARIARKKGKKRVQQKDIHDNKRKANTLTPPTTQPFTKIINPNETTQYHSPTDPNDTSTDGCAFQIGEENVTKVLILDPSDSSNIKPGSFRR